MSEPRPDYYKQLGIARDATAEEVISAVKQLVKINNPESFTDSSDRAKAQDKLKTIKIAYETLKDSTKRFEYDLLLDEQENVGSSKKSTSSNKKKSNFKLFTGLFLGTVAVTAGSTTYLTKLDCSNIRNIVDSTVCEKTKPIREIFGSTEIIPPVVVTAESANQTTPSEKPVETAPKPAVTNESTPVSKEPDVKNTEPVNVQVNVAADNSVNTAPVQETVSTSTPIGSSNECYDLWYQRNLAYAQKGYCFESNLGKRVFSDFKCSQTPEPLSATEKDKINQIKQKESSLNCRLNTDSTDVPSSAPIASQVQPAATLQPAQPVVQQPTNTGSSPAMQTVVVEGVGTTPQDAAQNAAQNALTNVVGTFIDANTMLQKRTLINDGIKSETKNISKDIKDYSQGSIKSFELLETKQESGLFRVNAKVTVRNENFSAYITQVAKGEAKVDSGLFVQAATEIKQRENLNGLLLENVISPLILGTHQELEIQKWDDKKIVLLNDAIKNNTIPDFLNFLKNYKSSPLLPNYIIFKVETHLNDQFLNNINRILKEIASKTTEIPFGSYLREDNFVFFKKQKNNQNVEQVFSFENVKLPLRHPYYNNPDIPKLKIILKDKDDNSILIKSMSVTNWLSERVYDSGEKSMYIFQNSSIYVSADKANDIPWSLPSYSGASFFLNEKKEFYVLMRLDVDILKELDHIVVTLDK
jgi:hypothetical protein